MPHRRVNPLSSAHCRAHTRDTYRLTLVAPRWHWAAPSSPGQQHEAATAESSGRQSGERCETARPCRPTAYRDPNRRRGTLISWRTASAQDRRASTNHDSGGSLRLSPPPKIARFRWVARNPPPRSQPRSSVPPAQAPCADEFSFLSALRVPEKKAPTSHVPGRNCKQSEHGAHSEAS